MLIQGYSEKSVNVIARSDFCDEAISNILTYIEARLLRFARNDKLDSFSECPQENTFSDKYYAKRTRHKVNIYRNGKKVDQTQ